MKQLISILEQEFEFDEQLDILISQLYDAFNIFFSTIEGFYSIGLAENKNQVHIIVYNDALRSTFKAYFSKFNYFQIIYDTRSLEFVIDLNELLSKIPVLVNKITL